MKLENVIKIDAPQEVVWAVTEDVERWPEWTPTVQSVKRLDQGQFDEDSMALLQQPGLPEAKWQVTSLARGKAFTWETDVWGMHMIATHKLETDGTGTKNTLRIEMSGLVARLLWPLLHSRIARALELENSGLKRRSEEKPHKG